MSVQTDESKRADQPGEPETSPAQTSGARREDGLFGLVFALASLATLVLVMVRVTMHAADPLDNTDTWFHLSLGHRFLDGDWSLAHPGQLSSFATVPWVPTQWSTEILMAAFDDWFGLPGVAWLFGLLYLVLIVAVFLLCRRHGALLPAAVASGVCVVAAGASLSARPQVVSLILFVVTVAAWSRASRTLRAPWWLVPLTWVWATAHGLWTAGILLGVVTVAGIAIDQRLPWRRSARLLAVPVLSVVAACLTPIGPRLLGSQLAVGSRTSMITEWGPTSFRDPAALLVALMVGVVVLRWARRGTTSWTLLLQLGLATGWVLMVTRMVPYGAILAAPLFVAALTEVLPARAVSTGGGTGAGRLERLVVLGAAALCLVGLTLAVPSATAKPAGVPTAFAPRLSALPDGSPVLVEDGTGAWMEEAGLGVDPFIDGMFDGYTLKHMQEFADLRSLEPGWTDIVRDSGARVAVLRKDSPLSAAIEDQLGWRQVQRDRAWVYLVAPSSAG